MTIYNSLEAAKILRISRKSPERLINRLCSKGIIRAQKPSRKEGWRIHEKALEDYLLLGGQKR